MATVHLPSGLTEFTGGIADVDIPARRANEILALLAERYPAMADQLNDMAVAIDGEIYQDAGYQPIAPSSEVHLVPRIAGG